MSTIPKIKGIAYEFASDVSLVIPPLNLRSLRALQERLATFKGGTDPESLGLVIDAAHAALLRNYPELERDELEDLVDLGNMLEVFEAVMDVGGVKRKEVDAKKASQLAP